MKTMGPLIGPFRVEKTSLGPKYAGAEGFLHSKEHIKLASGVVLRKVPPMPKSLRYFKRERELCKRFCT